MRPSIPAFAVMYTGRSIRSMCALIEPRLTTEPRPASRISGTTAWVAKKWWRRLICMNSSHSSTLSVSTACRWSLAALLTSTVTGPSRSPVSGDRVAGAPSTSLTSQCR